MLTVAIFRQPKVTCRFNGKDENLENETDAAYLKALFPSEQNSYIIHLGFNKKTNF